MMELDLDELRAAYDHPADKSVIEVIDRLERAEADVVNWKATAISRGERLEQAEQAVQRMREVASEYRPSIPEEVLHEVMKDILRTLDGDARRCLECNGTGDVQVQFNHGIQTQDCAVCFGTGDGRG